MVKKFAAELVGTLVLVLFGCGAAVLGGFEMARFPAVNAWLARVAALPGYVGLDG